MINLELGGNNAKKIIDWLIKSKIIAGTIHIFSLIKDLAYQFNSRLRISTSSAIA